MLQPDLTSAASNGPHVWLETCQLHLSWSPLIQIISTINGGVKGELNTGLCNVEFHSGDIEQIRICVAFCNRGGRMSSTIPVCEALSFRDYAMNDHSLKQETPAAMYHLDHVSINSRAFDHDVCEWSKFVQEKPILEAERSWSVGDNAFVTAAHFFGSNIPYMTIRDVKSPSALDHIGFRCTDEEAVYRAVDLVNSLGWAILNRPQFLDGSTLFHFRGPDQRVHDFFYPGAFIATEAN